MELIYSGHEMGLPTRDHEDDERMCLTSTRWRFEARLRRTKANSPICASDMPTYRITNK